MAGRRARRARARRRREQPRSQASPSPSGRGKVGAAAERSGAADEPRLSFVGGIRAGWQQAEERDRRPRRSSRRLLRRDRPQPLWGSFPLSEIVIAIGAVVTAIGFLRGPDSGAPLLIAGLAACVLAVLEIAVREHFTGFRSHSLLLALIATALVQTVFGIWLSSVWFGPVAVAGDILLFGALAGPLRWQFRLARERARAAGRFVR